MESATPEGEEAPGTAGFGLALLVDAGSSDSNDDKDFYLVAAMELRRGDPELDVELSADESEASDTSDDDSSNDGEPPVSYWNPEEGEAGGGPTQFPRHGARGVWRSRGQREQAVSAA
jgi:hypothetical protein